MKRRLIFFSILFLVLTLIAEALAFLALSAIEGRLATPGHMAASRRAIADLPEPESERETNPFESSFDYAEAYLSHVALHPYLGYVIDPAMNKNRGHIRRRWEGNQVSPLGFVGESRIEADPGKVVVGIFGGSLALHFSFRGIDRLAERLAADPAFAGRELVVVRGCIGGYKQPQQMIALNYLMSLGSHFDVVLNLDGYNDIALAYAENLRRKVTAYYPRSWPWLVHEVPDVETRRKFGETVYLRSRRTRLAHFFTWMPLDRSSIWNLGWKILDHRTASRLGRLEASIAAKPPTEVGRYVAAGPFRRPVSEEAAVRDIVDLWQRSSRQMARVCEAAGVEYFHFLQPNQYLPGSKPMGPEERATAIQEQNAVVRPMEIGYPLAIAAGAELAAEGVEFHDLTQVFADIDEPIYVDACCHTNPLGHELMAEAMAQAILAADRR